jgi:hypothetical protein
MVNVTKLTDGYEEKKYLLTDEEDFVHKGYQR